MKEDYEKILKLKHRDRITSKDISFIKEMHEKYLSSLRKVICWQCPASIREAMFDCIRFVENNPIEDETKTITEQRPSEIGENSERLSGTSKSGKRSNSNKK